MIGVIADCGIYGTVGTWSSYQVYEATYTPLLLFYFYCMCRGKCRKIMIKDNHGYNQYTKEEIIELAQNWFNEHGRLVQRDLKHSNGLPSSCQVTKHFGTLQNLLKEAGIQSTTNPNLFNREQLSDEEMLENYKKFVEEHLKTHMFLPTNDDLDRCQSIQCTSVYISRFGSFNNVNKLIGYEGYNNKVLEEDMISKYKRACKEYGKVLSSREITKIYKATNNYIYSTEAYLNHFGTLHNLQELCGFDKTRPGMGATREELIEKLQWLGNVLGRRPLESDLKLYKRMPSGNAYFKEFGSFRKALNEAGFEKQKIYETKNGTKCRSTYELKLAQVLESYNISFENEVLYKDVIPNFKRKYRFDFVVELNNRKYYIELFGIEGNELYEKRKKEKIQICEENNIPLIQLYQSDIYSKTNQEIYETLFNYIEDLKEVA